MKSKLTKISFGSAVLALLACQAAAQGKISGITTKSVGDGLEVQIKGEKLSAPKIVRLRDGRSFTLEFDASMTSDPQWLRVEQNGVHYVQTVCEQSSPSKIRIHLRVEPNTKLDYGPDAEGYYVKATTGTTTATTRTEETAATTTIPPIKSTPASTPKSVPLSPAKTMPTSTKKTVPATTKKSTPLDTANAGTSTKVGIDPNCTTKTVKIESQPEHLTAAPAQKKQAPSTHNATFPEKVPSLDMTPIAPAHSAPAKITPARMVSLDFVNTEIVQILKGISMQAGVNIITSPDVKGALTVSLGSVSIKEALDLITTMSGLKYAQLGNTYVVTSPGNLNRVLVNLGATQQEISVTRVVPIFSGESTHIKDALRTADSDVEILLPSEKPLTPAALAAMNAEVNGPTLDQKTGPGGTPAPGSPAAMQQGQAQQSQTNNDTKGQKDAYVVLVGPASRVGEVEKQVKDVDAQMCNALGIDYPHSNEMEREVYHPQGNTAASLLKAISTSTDKSDNGDFHAKVGTVDIYATPTGSSSAQSVVLYGRKSEVDRLMINLQNIDQLSSTAGDWVVYGVKYLDPRALREDVVAKFPGLTVNVAPSAAANPAIYTIGNQVAQNQEKTASQVGANQPSGAQSGNTISGSTATNTSAQQADTGQNIGIYNPFAATEMDAVPMKLVLRGTKDQLQSALSYINVVDVEPKQVALELRVMELSKEDALKLGIDWNLLTGGTVQSISMSQGVGNVTNAGNIGGALGFAHGGQLNLAATLDQLAGTTKMIARPNMLAVDGRETEMFVGDDIKYIQSIQSTQNGVSVQTGDVQVGVHLAVLPRIGADDSITMDLRPSVSTLNSFTPVPGGGQIPQTGIRIAQSTMVIHSGDTIALGGLIQDNDTKSRSRVPILGDIPIIGMLFSRTNNDHKRTEVVFFLTANVVDNNSKPNAANPWAHDPHSLGGSVQNGGH